MSYIKKAEEVFQIIWSLGAILNLIVLWNEGALNYTVAMVTGVTAFLYLVCVLLGKLFEKISESSYF